MYISFYIKLIFLYFFHVCIIYVHDICTCHVKLWSQANLLCPFSLSFSPVNVSISSATSGGWSQAAKNAAWDSCSWSQTVSVQRGTKLLSKKKLIFRRSCIVRCTSARCRSKKKKSRIYPWNISVNGANKAMRFNGFNEKITGKSV